MDRHRSVWLAVLTLAIASLFAAQANACAFATYPATWYGGGDADFHDWGLILQDARGPVQQCAEQAHWRLVEKLSLAPDNYWQQFLSGEYVMLVMASGLALGGRGDMTPTLDARLKCVIDRYMFVMRTDDPCGWSPNGGQNRGNTCMDDWSIAASGYAWMAAYLRMSGRDWTGMRWQTLDAIHHALSTDNSVCIYDPRLPLDPLKGPCNACPYQAPSRDPNQRQCPTGIDALGTYGVQILSLNDGIQAPPYGIGLMANISAAFMGLEQARAPINVTSEISADERKILQFIWIEA